jgi:hypothetical protein
LTTDNIILREFKEADPSNWSSDVHYEYSKKTLTSSLRPHIKKHHLELFTTLAKEKEWKILLPGLVSQAQSQAASEAAASQHEPPINFDERTFYQYLVNFIIADDQVHSHLIFFLCLQCSCLRAPILKSLNLVECPEFRRLLILLQKDIENILPRLVFGSTHGTSCAPTELGRPTPPTTCLMSLTMPTTS